MLGFWFLLALLIAGAVYVLLRPLLRPVSGDMDRRALNLRVFKERLAELDNERASGRIDEAAFAGLKFDLESKLLEDIPENADAPARLVNVIPLLWLLFLSVPILALSLYIHLGSPERTEIWQRARADSHNLTGIVAAIDDAGAKQNLPAMQFAVLRLRALLMTEPDNIDAWYALGRTYIGLNQTEAGVAALEQGYRHAPDDVQMMVGYAQGLILANDGQATEESERLLRKALAINPKHEGALMLLGFGAFNAGRYGEAIAHWETLKASRPHDSEGARLLEQSIAQAKARLAQAVKAPAESHAATVPPAKLAVQVSLSEEMKARIAPTDRVFIFARAAEGPPMPLAVVTTEAGKLPINVELSDEQAMMPALKLSAFERVVVGARVSKSGQATPQPGDLEGLSAPFERAAQSTPLTIVINSVHP